MKDEDKTKAELIKQLKTLRKERGKSALTEITERKQAEEKLIKNEKPCKEIQSLAHIGYWNYELCDDIITWSDELYSIFEINKDAGPLSIEDFLEHIHPEDRDTIRKQIEKGESYRTDYRIVMNNGSVKHIHEETLIERQEDGKIVLMEGTAQDITERKKAEEELRDSEERLKILFDYAPDAYYTSDLRGNFVDGNKAAERLIGYKKEELIGKNFLKLKLLSLTDIPKAAKLLAKNLRRLPTGPNEFALNRKDNSKVVVEISTYPVKIKGRTLALGIARDITERKKAEEFLQESEAKYRAVLEQSADNIFLVDLETKKILESNVSLRNLLGYSADEMKKLTIYDFIARSKDEIKKKLEQLQKEDKTAIRERKYLRKDGSLVDVEMVRNLITFGNKKVLCVVSRDISERKQSEERLKKTMDATIETMSRMIEVKDPYTAGHQYRVSQLATAIAKELNLPEDKIEGIRIASLIHDIGKIGLPTEILSKPTKLTDIEFSLIKGHSQIGYDILKSIDFSYPIAQIVLQHHEKINGSGYPNNLKGDEILLEAKIIGVADVVEAMSSFRPYRPALGIDKALEEISKNRGILYAPEVVDACLRLFKEKGFKFKE